MAAAVTCLLDRRGRTAGARREHRSGFRSPAHRAADRAVSLHRAGLDRRRGRAAHGGGHRPQRRRARFGRFRAGPSGVRPDPPGGTGPGRRGERGAEPVGGAAGPRVPGPAAAGLPARTDRPEHRGVAAVGARRLPPGARRCDDPGRRAAALVHLAASGGARPARGGAGRGPARLRGVAADPGGAGVPGRYGPGADLSRGGGGGAGGGAAARRGGPAVPAPRRCAHLAGPYLGPPAPRTAEAS